MNSKNVIKQSVNAKFQMKPKRIKKDMGNYIIIEQNFALKVCKYDNSDTQALKITPYSI